MEKTLLVYMLIFGISLFLLVLMASRGDAIFPQRWAKVRVRIDENRSRHTPEPRDEEMDPLTVVQILIAGMMILILILASST